MIQKQFDVKRMALPLVLLLLCIGAAYGAGSAKIPEQNTVVIEILDDAVPSKEQLDLKIENYHLKFRKILHPKDTPLLHRKNLYIYNYTGNTESLKNILENHLYTRANKNRSNTNTIANIEGIQPAQVKQVGECLNNSGVSTTVL